VVLYVFAKVLYLVSSAVDLDLIRFLYKRHLVLIDLIKDGVTHDFLFTLVEGFVNGKL